MARKTKSKTKPKTKNTPKPVNAAADAISLGQLGKDAWGWVKENPGAAIGTGILGATNLGGLFDNGQILGQGIGAGVGALVPMAVEKLLGKKLDIGGLGRANLIMGGGALGALFDTLRAKQIEDQQRAKLEAQYASQYR